MKIRKKPLGTKNLVGRNITRIRKARHMTQKRLAELMQVKGVDINPGSLSKIEGQNRPINDKELYAIAEIFQIDTEQLKGEHNDWK